MSKYESYHFSPQNNRSLLMPKIKKGEPYTPPVRSASKRYLFQPVLDNQIDSQNPYFQVTAGFYQKEVELSGEKRPYSVYVPPKMISKGPAALIFAPGGMTGKEFLESENWKSLSDQYHTAFLILESPKWNADHIEQEFDYAETVVNLEFNQRLTVDICESYIYPMGFEDGAGIAAAFALTYSATFAAFAVDGNCFVDSELLTTLRNLPSDGIDTKKKNEIPISAFLIDRPGNASDVFSYIKEILHSQEEGLHNKYGNVYLENPRPGAYFINEQPVAQGWFCDNQSVAGISKEELNEKMLAFVSKYARWGGFGNNHLRLRRTLAETGVHRVEKNINGLPRFWDIYVPSCYQEGEDKEYPLVVAIHGMSCNSEYFEQTSDWQRIAESRGFFVAFASGYPTNDGLARFPVPHWVTEPNKNVDEITYFKELLDYMEAFYRIDKKRIYAVGHSNGSKMTQLLIQSMPERFAAFGPTGFLAGYNPSEVPSIDVNVPIPVWFMMGEYDVVDSAIGEGTLATKTLKAYCTANNMELQLDNFYDNGNYHTLVIYDTNHVPMVQYTLIKGCPHTYTAEMAQMTWDQFLCHFTREADGTIKYYG